MDVKNIVLSQYLFKKKKAIKRVKTETIWNKIKIVSNIYIRHRCGVGWQCQSVKEATSQPLGNEVFMIPNRRSL